MRAEPLARSPLVQRVSRTSARASLISAHRSIWCAHLPCVNPLSGKSGREPTLRSQSFKFDRRGAGRFFSEAPSSRRARPEGNSFSSTSTRKISNLEIFIKPRCEYPGTNANLPPPRFIFKPRARQWHRPAAERAGNISSSVCGARSASTSSAPSSAARSARMRRALRWVGTDEGQPFPAKTAIKLGGEPSP